MSAGAASTATGGQPPLTIDARALRKTFGALVAVDSLTLGVVASELAWDAVLAAVAD